METAETEIDWERRAHDFLRRPVPDEVMERGVLMVADVLAAAVVGAEVPYNERVGEAAAFADGRASVLGGDRTVEPGAAALVNAAAAITQEIEEGHNTGGHVGAGIVTGGFAVAEQFDADGDTFVEACVKSYELCTRLEHAIFAVKDRMNEALPWLVRNPHSTWTTVGPALAGALCMDHEAGRIHETLRIAANLAVVSMHDPYVEGAEARNYTAGFSAQAGVNVALVAAAGLRGSRSAMTAVYDPLREMTNGTFDREMSELGERWEIQRNYFKLTPSCRYTHPPLGALEQIRDEIDPQQVASIDVYSYRNATDLDHADPETPTSAKFSIPYVLARSLLHGNLGLEDFSEEAIADEATKRLAETVSVKLDERYEKAFPEHWSARIEVTHEDGRTVSAECLDPPGDYRRAPDPEVLNELIEELFAYRLGEAGGRRAIETVLDIRNRDVRDVGAALRR